MAAAPESILQALCEESTCSICLDYFRDPVSITECGHNFCRACLSQSRGESGAQATCPQCRGTFQKRNLRPNWQLASIVEIARVLPGQGVRGAKGAEGKGRACGRHQEPLKLFCRDHEDGSHAGENARESRVPGQPFPAEQVTLFKVLKLPSQLRKTRSTHSFLQEQTKAEREGTVAQFRRLHQFLEEQEKHVLAQVDKLLEAIARKAEDHLAWLSKKLFSLEGLMREVEEKSRQLAAELLQVGGGRSPHIPRGDSARCCSPLRVWREGRGRQ
uniref:RING-type domain-containing protein n=1 Tax=Varanus komodoensis TaxID=61221 RepID=A0A8D2LB79_VARKO